MQAATQATQQTQQDKRKKRSVLYPPPRASLFVLCNVVSDFINSFRHCRLVVQQTRMEKRPGVAASAPSTPPLTLDGAISAPPGRFLHPTMPSQGFFPNTSDGSRDTRFKHRSVVTEGSTSYVRNRTCHYLLPRQPRGLLLTRLVLAPAFV